MEYRNLGGSDIKVSAVGLGCMGMTHAYGAPSDETEMIPLIHAAVDRGITFFDTAECYIGTDKRYITKNWWAKRSNHAVTR